MKNAYANKPKQKTDPRIKKVIETVWDMFDGLRAFEEVVYETKEENGAVEKKEISRACGFMNEEGVQTIPPIYDVVWNFKGGLAKVCRKGRWGLIDRCGKEVVPIEYETLYETSDGMLQVQLKGQWGCLKKDGTTVVKPRYDYIFPFRFGFATVKQNGKYGFVNLADEEVVAPCFDEAGLISAGGVVKVRNGSQWQEAVL